MTPDPRLQPEVTCACVRQGMFVHVYMCAHDLCVCVIYVCVCVSVWQ